VLNAGNKPLITGEAPSGGLSLEMPAAPLNVDRILWSWYVRKVIDNASEQIGYDFVFIVFYSGLLIFACVRLHQAVKQAGVAGWKKYALLGGAAAALAGVLDVLENFGMLKFIANYTHRMSSPESLVTLVHASALTKFILIGVSLLVIAALDVRLVASRQPEGAGPGNREN